MSLLTDIEYWESRGWDGISKANQAVVTTFEKCRKVYVQGIKEGVIDPDDSDLGFKFDLRVIKRGMFSISEIRRAGAQINLTVEQLDALEFSLKAIVPDNQSYFLKFR